jgi:hypothetical protein
MMKNLYLELGIGDDDIRTLLSHIHAECSAEQKSITQMVSIIEREFREEGNVKVWDYIDKEQFFLLFTSRQARLNGLYRTLLNTYLNHIWQHIHERHIETTCDVCSSYDSHLNYDIIQGLGLCMKCQSTIWYCDLCKVGHSYYTSAPMRMGDKNLCAKCYEHGERNHIIARCAACTNPYYANQLIDYHSNATGEVHKICPFCDTNRVYFCEQCDSQLLEPFDPIRYDDDDRCLCQDCYNTGCYVAEYDYYDNHPKFLTTLSEKHRDDTLFFGCEFELEMDWNKYSQDMLTEQKLGRIMAESVTIANWGYVKHDGSMCCGVEFVTNPMSEQWYKQNRQSIDETFGRWKHVGFRTDQFDTDHDRYNCSMHVHMSKAAFSVGHLYKFVRFFYKIPMRKLVQVISGRDENEYAQFCPQDFKYSTRLAKEKKNVSENRYSVINLIGGHWHERNMTDAPTVEFRLFQGSMKPAIIHKNIEFLLSVYYFTRDNSITHITKKNYFKYLGTYKNKYRNLINFLNDQTGEEI